ncbi:chl4 [Grosmannia clavigera kw1407]|uniref:Chl4 n=1 Tax=Grosmannia clavigera (strain kw1407 / UAMH 11150) TaxID=655863 RepID=F0XA78_GROCL|nr:chl4 [Grosmannia clavigera kw1407]EFX05984.1 chl4 [Grosmannia clavigera kw1407]
MARISIPVASRLSSSLRISPSNPVVTRILGRLSRPSLLSLVLDWLADGNQALTGPYLRQQPGEADYNDDDDDFYPPAASLEALREHYSNVQLRKGSKREVLDRVLEGDWRHGVSMYQLAMADVQYLYDHPTSQKWTAFRIVPMKPQLPDVDDGSDSATAAAASAIVDTEALVVPRFHPSTFLRNLQAQILPDVKVHYNFDRHKHLPLLLLRIFILDSPYNTARAVVDGGTSAASLATVEASRTVYVAFPDASPFVYLSSSQTSEQQTGPGAGVGAAAPPPTARETRGLRNLVVEAIPKALSRPQERYGFRPTSMVTRNLSEMLHRRGAGRTNTAGGGWAIYADEKTIESPLSTVLPTPPLSEVDDDKTKEGEREKRRRTLSPGAERERRLAKRRRLVAEARFGPTARMDDGLGVERVDIVIQDPFPGDVPGEQEDVERPTATMGPIDHGRPKGGGGGGRRSQIGAVLAREIEVQDDEDMARGADEAGPESSNVWRPQVAFTFHGSHVFAGIRQLVEAGVIDGTKMPGWMTGEEGVTVGAIRHGRIRGHKGSGML